MSEKLVTVYVNTYNAQSFIKETVNSILNQTYKNLKVTVVDDCSTDNTLKVLSKITDKRLSVITLSENSHISNALNTGLKKMTGTYIAHCDADDVWEPDKIKKQVEFLENNKKYGAVFTHSNMIDENGKINNALFPVDEIYNIKNRSQAEMFNFLLNCSNHFNHSTFLARKEVISKVGFYDLSMPTLHDYDYWLRLLTVCPVYILEEPLIRCRVHQKNNSSMNEGKWNSHDAEYLRAVKKAIEICPDKLFCDAFRNDLKLSGRHTKAEVTIEKAFVLSKISTPLSDNPVMAVDAFCKIVNDEKLLKTAKEKFGFNVKDLYEIQKQRQFNNPTAEKIKDDLINDKENQIKAKDKQISEQHLQIVNANNTIAEFQNSFFWKLTKPMRVVSQKIKDSASKNVKLINALIFIKAFLLHGIKGVKAKRDILFGHKTKEYIPVSQTISEERRKNESSYKFEKEPKFSILVPLYNTPKDFLYEMIKSVTDQTYKNFELCLADGSSKEFNYVGEYCTDLSKNDNRIKYKKLTENKGISENTNECIKMATGDYIALFDHDDILHPSALFEYAKVINEQNADFIYCDEDKFDKLDGKFYDPYYKPDFAPDNLRANNYICHFTVFKKSLLNKVGTFRSKFDGSQDHDLILRLTEKAKTIVHIPKILYRWRVSAASVASDPYAKPYTITAGINAVKEHLDRIGLKGEVESSPFHPNFYRIKYDIIGQPLVSIMIPNFNHAKDLDRCIMSIINKSTYKNYEIIIIENNSNEETFKYYETLKKYDNIKVVVYKPEPNEFNYSAINNYGFKFIKGEHIILLNNDVEIISPDWIQEMLMFSQRKDVGAVGAMLYYPNDTIQHAGVILGIGGVAGHSHKYFPRNTTGYFGRPIMQQNLSAVTAACLMMKSEIFKNLGGFDETFKVAFNDVDLCMRIRKSGYNIIFTPYCELYHYESISRGSEDTDEKKKRFEGEVLRFKSRYGEELKNGDPYYNPNLTLTFENFSYK